MDAIMFALIGVLLANADGRSGSDLSQLLAARRDGRRVMVIAFAVFVLHALIAATGGAIANGLIGPGVAAVFVALALLSAAAALLWRTPRPVLDAGVSPAHLAGRMFVQQFGDRSHFLIAALAATSGAGLWAAAGGSVGWTLAILPFLAFGPLLAERRSAQGVRWASALILAIWGLRSGLGAFGLIG